jgi:succinyl-CoA synthetase beta subunit
MKIHEYQAKRLFKDFGIPVPEGSVAHTKEEVMEIADKIGYPCVIKAQVHAGGRGKAGGVKLAKNRDEALRFAEEIIGMHIKNIQTGAQGKKVRKVLVEEGVKIVNELYLALIMDREKAMPVIIASLEGGMEIEKVAERHPEHIFKEYIHPVTGLSNFHNIRLSFKLGLNKTQRGIFSKLVSNLYKLFNEKDASIVEINPLIITNTEELIALDAKVNFDDNALIKHSDIMELRDIYEEDPFEVEASKYELNYIKLDGNIGCMVNGAGLAMATMDILKYYKGEPANFLDVGGGTSEERIKEAFKILIADKNVKVVFINIFGGIVRTDIVASGVVNAARSLNINIPVVILLRGTNEKQAGKIINESGLNFISEVDFKKAALKSVELSRGD